MNLAISILVIIAVASVIGTVLQQNQPYVNYVKKFGPFWHEVFQTLSLYNVYGANWFLGLLVFLIASTSICIYRNSPVMLRDIKNYRLKSKIKTLRTIDNKYQWALAEGQTISDQSLQAFLHGQGFSTRVLEHEDRRVIGAMRGKWNRLGYIFTHVGIIVLCVGGLVDANFDVAYQRWLKGKDVDTTSELVRDVPEKSRFKPGDLVSFRGNTVIPEGHSADYTLLQIDNGTLVQELPFRIELKDFRVEHYNSGQPKSFESDLVIHDDRLKEPLQHTIAVNHPLTYRGYTIYQASFEDGGSKLKLNAWPFYTAKLAPLPLNGEIKSSNVLETTRGQLAIEYVNFKKYNVVPAGPEDPAGHKFKNLGSSMVFKVRDASGSAREYINYMSPIVQEGRNFFITGMRSLLAADYRYLHIPADKNFSVERFMRFHALLNDTPQIQRIASEEVEAVIQRTNDGAQYKQNIITSMMNLTDLFNRGGYQAVEKDIRDKVPPARQAQIREAYLKVLDTILRAVYFRLLEEEKIDTKQPVSKFDQQFYADALRTMSQLHAYGTPFYLQLVDFQHVEAAGLSIAKMPGTGIFYLGCLMVIIGVFQMFYVAHQRLWIVQYQENGVNQVLLAGSGNRNQRDFAEYFNSIRIKLDILVSDKTTQA